MRIAPAHRHAWPLATLVCLAANLGGCADDDARSALLRTLYTDQDRELAAERPDWVAEKYATMATSRWTYLRGSAIAFYFDAAGVTGEPALAHADGAEDIDLDGDLHLENVGAVPAGEATIFDFTDFDASVRGPYDWDLRRAALAIATLDGQRAGHPPAGESGAVAAFVGAFLDGYLLGLGEPGEGALARADLSSLVAAQLADADGRLVDREDLAKYTELVDGQRRIQRTSELVDAGWPWNDGLDQALAAWAQTRRGGPPTFSLRLKDVARRLGAGVGSLALHRFYVLLEAGEGEDDDLLLEVKEIRDPPEPVDRLGRGPTLDGRPSGSLLVDNAARAVLGASRLLSSASAELDLGRTSWNGVGFQVRSATRGRRNLDEASLVTGLDSGEITAEAFAGLTRDLGRLLGRAHARTHPDAAPIIAATIDARFRERAIERALADGASLAADLERFRDLLARHGPLLGARAP